MKLDKMIPLLKEITHVKVGERERGREEELFTAISLYF
jgi:hypothetical protein